MHTHTASGIVSDGIDDVTTKDIERLETLDLEGKLVPLQDEAATESERAVQIHFAVVKRIKGFDYIMKFHTDHPYLERRSSFTSAILAAYEKRDYRAILSWRPEKTPNLLDVLRPAIARQYSVPYKGQAACVFANFVQTLAHYNERPLYANVIPVIQSSGTGKSRMLMETGKSLFTLPFCARKGDSVGWPPGDRDMLASLLESNNNQFDIQTHIIFIAFLAAIFTEMKRVLESFGTSDIDTLRKKWHAYIEHDGASTNPTRDAFYANALKDTKKNELEMQSWNSKIFDLDCSKGLRPEFFDKLAARVNDLSRKFLKAKVEALLDVIPEKVLLVYMDEAHTFGNRYWALQRVLWTLNEHRRLWFSFIGTDASSLSEFVPAADDLKSLRSAEEMMLLLPPYTALGFDQNAIDTDQYQTVTMGQVRSLEWICAFGRPLWKAMLESIRAVSVDSDAIETTVFRNAKTKLLCSFNFDGKITEQVFAVLAYTVCLDLVIGNRNATKFADTSVAKYMRLLIDINESRTISYTHASSEPILALVGASIVANPEYLRKIIHGLTYNLLKNGLVDKGRHGELLARMILFIARIGSCSSPSTPLSFATPVPLVHFFKTLFGDSWNEATGHERFEKDLHGGYVNFYHFALTVDTIPVIEDLDLETNLWSRGTALQCSFRQVDINGHIPVYWGPINEDAVLDASNFSSIDFQVKLRNIGDTVSADRIQRPASDRGAERKNHPFIAVFLDMDSDENYKSTESRLCLETGEETLERLKKLDLTELPARTQKTVKKAIEKLELDPNRYCISARGCDEHVFGVLKTMGIATVWKQLVEITEETPKVDGELVKTMLPLDRLNLGSGYCDWMNVCASHK